MSPPNIKAQTFFGLKTNILGNAHFTTDTEVIYPAGGALVLHDFAAQEQRFIKLPENQKKILSITRSPNKQFIALSEKNELENEKPTLKIFDLETLELKRSLTIPFEEITSTEFIAVQFTCNSEYLVAVVGEPDWMLYYYHWEDGKIESYTKALNTNSPGKVTMLNCNPNDVNVVVVSGPQTFRLLNVSESVWRQWGWTKAENLNITSCMWLTADKVMFGTNTGILMVVENGELKQNCCYRALEVKEIIIKKKDDRDNEASHLKDQVAFHSDTEVRCLTVFPKGFVYSCKSGYLHMFERESRIKWVKRNVFKVIEKPFRISDQKSVDLNKIQYVSVNEIQDTLIITTLKSQIYYVKLFEQHMDQIPVIPFKEMGEMLHHKKINGLAMCLWKPIFMTSGEVDRSIRLWNYEEKKLEFVKFYCENINCISLHPTGIFALIAFADKLRYMAVLIDDLYQIREFAIQDCKVCKFSSNGHMFAAVDNMVIKIFSSISFNNIFTLKGHCATIRDVSWAGADDKIVSCGADGAIYEWCMLTSKRLSEVIVKNNDFTGCSMSSDGKSSYIVGVDGEVKEARNDSIIRNLKLIGVKLDNILLAHSDMMLFVSGGKGTIVSIQFPLLDKAVFEEFHMHDSNITAIGLSYDDQTIISVSEDATMCIWKLDNSEGKALVLNPDFKHSEEILINKSNLREKIAIIEELSKRIKEMEMEHAFNLRQISMDTAEDLRTVHTNYTKEIERLHAIIEKMEHDYTIEKTALLDEIINLNNNHQNTTRDMDSDMNEKLIFEYEKYNTLVADKNKMEQDYEDRLQKLEETKNGIIEDQKNSYEAQLREKELMIKELCEKNDLESKEHEYIKQTIENDADREILEIKSNYEAKLIEGKKSNVMLKGETNVLKKKIMAFENKTDDYKFKVAQLKTELDSSKRFIHRMELQIIDLKKAIEDRDRNLQEKEKGMQALRADNQTLEKHKFVLEFNIEELKEQTEPKNRLIIEQKNQIQTLTTEKNDLILEKEKLDLDMVNLKERLSGVQSENKKQMEKIYDLRYLLKKIHNETVELSSNIQKPAQLKTAVKDLITRYRDLKHPEEIEIPTKEAEHDDNQYYKNLITNLNYKLKNEEMKSKQENARIIQENLSLIEKINSFRQEIHESHEQCNKMQILLGLPPAQINPKSARSMIDKACADYDKIKKDFTKTLEEKEEEIDVLKKQVEYFESVNVQEEIEALKREFEDFESANVQEEEIDGLKEQIEDFESVNVQKEETS